MKGKHCIVWLSAVFSAFFVVLAVVIGICGIPVSAEDAKAEATEVPLKDSSDAGGIKVTTSADKKYYSDGDTAVVTVSVTNTNDYDVTDVGVTYKMPTNFTATSGKLSQEVDKLAAGETKEFQITATVNKSENGEIVMASYFTPPFIILIVVVAVVILLAVFLLIRKLTSGKKGAKPPKTGVSMLLILALLSACISNAAFPSQAKTKDGLLENEDFLPRVSVHDPSVVKDPKTGMYYIFGSHLDFARSKDLIRWEKFTTNISQDYEKLFAEPWEWAEYATPDSSGTLRGRMWAPDVIWNETMKKWCMYMSIDGDNWCSSVCLLTADNIEGPYEYQGIVVYSGMNNSKTPPEDLSKTDVYKVLGEGADLTRYRSTSNGCINAIDPNVCYDDAGNLYMTYGSWSAGIYMLKLDTTTGLRDYDTKYETKENVSDAYLGTKMAGGHYNSGEAPYIIKSGKYYYFFISYAGFVAKGGYQMRIYRSENITGPYVDQAGNSPICDHSEDMKATNKGVKIFGSYDMSGMATVQVSQGHNSALVDDDGKIYLVYHTRFQSQAGTNEVHQVRVHQLFVNEDGWLVAAPYEYSGETLPEEAYSVDEVEGEYDFIYHEPTKFYNVVGDKQMGIIGSQEVTTKEIELQKELVVGHRKTALKCTVSYSHEGAEKVILKKDGTVTGDFSGTWKFTNGCHAEMNLNGTTYKGVFLKQQDESIDRKPRMTFSLLGDNVTVWGVTADKEEAEKD